MLYEVITVLSAFAWRKLNLSRIESRPTKKRLGSYYFYMDVLAALDAVLLPSAIEDRITSYNVCYTKLLRSWRGTVAVFCIPGFIQRSWC